MKVDELADGPLNELALFELHVPINFLEGTNLVHLAFLDIGQGLT